jgi:predicted ATPase/class 3 adenylate cyclase
VSPGATRPARVEQPIAARRQPHVVGTMNKLTGLAHHQRLPPLLVAAIYTNLSATATTLCGHVQLGRTSMEDHLLCVLQRSARVRSRRPRCGISNILASNRGVVPITVSRADLPTGTVTFMFTDIEGSTRLLQDLGAGYQPVQKAHDSVMRRAIRTNGGVEVHTIGDAFFAVFRSSVAAVAAAAQAQRAVAAGGDLAEHDVRVRIGLHTGEAILGGDDYSGIDVNTAARVSAAAHGGQVLLSDTTAALARNDLPEGVSLVDLGVHALKDVGDIHLSQLAIDGLNAQFPPVRGHRAPPNNLPSNLPRLVGREDDLRRAGRLLDGTRLLTLTGPGGVGKTSLALRMATDRLHQFPDGTFFAPLATVAAPDLVASAIVDALGLPSVSPDAPPAVHLLRYLADRTLLLVLDNFEQVLDASGFVAEILERSRGTKIIVTSRAALQIRGEQEMEVPPLHDAAAVRLFENRARAVLPSFVIDDATAGDVAALTKRLDGLPLAIELAASWTKILPTSSILERVGGRGLGGTRRDLPARQRTLYDTIDWSYQLLEEPARLLFERLSVFVGGATLGEVEAVCRADDELGVDLLEFISALLDHSLLTRVDHRAEPRFTMLKTIRDYARSRLEERGGAGPIADRHAGVFATWAEGAEPNLTRSNSAPWLERFTVEHGNLRAALHHSLGRGDADTARRLASNMWRFWQMRGHLREGREAVERTLTLAGGSARPLAKALEAAGGIAYWQGDTAASYEFYERALAMQLELGDDAAIAYARYNLAFACLVGDEPAQAMTLLEHALDAFKELGDPRGIAVTTWGLGNAHQSTHELDEAAQYLAAAIEAFQPLDEPFSLGWAHFSMGEVTAAMGRPGQARDHFERGLRLFAEVNDLSAAVMFVAGFAAVAALEGDTDRAVRLAGALVGLREKSGADLVEVGSTMPEIVGEVMDVESLAAARPHAFSEGRAMTAAEAVTYALGRSAESS